LGFEPLLLALSSADREVRILNAVVLPEPARPVQVPQIQLIQSGPVRRQPVGRDCLRLDRLVVQEAPQKSERSLCVPSSLDHKVEDLAFVVDGPPKVHPLAANPADHLIQVPARRRSWPTPPQAPGDQRPEFDGPAADRLVADLDPALRQQLLDVSKTETESKIQPHSMADHISRKPVTFERDLLHDKSSPTAAYADIAGDLLALA
jgi:hypothetical protein